MPFRTLSFLEALDVFRILGGREVDLEEGNDDGSVGIDIVHAIERIKCNKRKDRTIRGLCSDEDMQRMYIEVGIPPGAVCGLVFLWFWFNIVLSPFQPDESVNVKYQFCACNLPFSTRRGRINIGFDSVRPNRGLCNAQDTDLSLSGLAGSFTARG